MLSIRLSAWVIIRAQLVKANFIISSPISSSSPLLTIFIIIITLQFQLKELNQGMRFAS